MSHQTTVTIAIPVLNEEQHLGACLDAIEAQTYPDIVEILVVDGGSTDRTREVAGSRAGVRVLENGRRIQSAALNIAIEAAKGDVFVRVDGHCLIAADYVARCIEALQSTGAAMVGGGMTPIGEGPLQEGVAQAMSSRFGAGPARFHVGGEPAWTDTVYLGAFSTALARRVGGYAEDVGVNEDAELAIRLAAEGGIWFDPAIRSTYVPRGSVAAVARQFYRYGRSRARTVRRHPGSLSLRQLIAPALVLGLVSPWRKRVLLAYGAGIVGVAASRARVAPRAAPTMVVVLPAMHIPWGVGFLLGLAQRRAR